MATLQLNLQEGLTQDEYHELIRYADETGLSMEQLLVRAGREFARTLRPVTPPPAAPGLPVLTGFPVPNTPPFGAGKDREGLAA